MAPEAAAFWGDPAMWGPAFYAILPVWLLGALIGYLLPRPVKGQAATWTVMSLPANFRWALGFYHFALIVRTVWTHFTRPGTFRSFCKALLHWSQGQGWHFDFPALAAEGGVEDVVATTTTRDADNWYVTQKDLAFFQYHMEANGDCPGASAWEVMMEKDLPGLVRYTAWRRTLANGKSEYKSVTISPDATAQEFIDLYFDDDFRPKWDSMIIHHEVVENGDFAQRQQVVRWVRRFPFKFLSDREYFIARRLFKQDDAMYGLTKVVDHSSARKDSPVVRVDDYYSMWRSRTVADPWGSDKPATETLLFHHEQLKIMENLSRFAVRHGMWGFVKTLSECTPDFIGARRARVGSNEPDAMAYGYNGVPNPPANGTASPAPSSAGGAPHMIGRLNASQSALSLCSMDSSNAGGSAALGGGASSLSRQGSSGLPLGKVVPTRVKGLLAVAMASGFAVMMRRSTSVPAGLSSVPNVKSLKSRRQNLRRQTSLAF
ncbi:hypothetical protein HYH03_002352 [Edaphochlamys debaryana]|uniref:START domain-containing protein n=1 Tax=Edaphochlamys debaryana TaxID=47281 RepID=A0A835YK62_9CHLO|nr:hypothetical protein HYH03_002352 [Edaphochlamys debaryana]|eukprot:KAG2500075.1 hypothetical protein HYH03_002352 [Edaphochlamys debaryana]